MLQLQHAIGALRQNCVMRCQDGGEPILAMQSLHQHAQKLQLRFARPDLRWAHRPATGLVAAQARGRSPRCLCCSPPDNSPARCAVGSRFQADFPEPARGGLERLTVPLAAHQQWHRHIFGRRKISQQVVPLPYKTDRAIAALIRKLAFPKRICRFLLEVYCTARWRV